MCTDATQNQTKINKTQKMPQAHRFFHSAKNQSLKICNVHRKRQFEIHEASVPIQLRGAFCSNEDTHHAEIQ
jgi:hypothetical protein